MHVLARACPGNFWQTHGSRVHAGRGRVLEEAFRDLRALMDKAAEMVSLAERFRVALAQQACHNPNHNPTGHPTLPWAPSPDEPGTT